MLLQQHIYRSRQIIRPYGPQNVPISKISEGTCQWKPAQPSRSRLRGLIEGRSRIPFVLLAVLALSIAVLRFNEGTSASHSGLTAVAATEASINRITAFVDVLDDIIDVLEDIADDLAGAEAEIGSGLGPLWVSMIRWEE